MKPGKTKVPLGKPASVCVTNVPQIVYIVSICSGSRHADWFAYGMAQESDERSGLHNVGLVM